MLEDIYRSIKLSVYERAVSPLFGSFLIAWGLWNYRFLLIFFSNLEVEDKLTLFNDLIFPDKWEYFFSSGFVYPLLKTRVSSLVRASRAFRVQCVFVYILHQRQNPFTGDVTVVLRKRCIDVIAFV